MTDERLAELEALANAATPANEMSMRLDEWIEWRSSDGIQKYSIAEFDREPDRDFFFHARTAMPELISEVRRLREEVAAERETCARIADIEEGKCREMIKRPGFVYSEVLNDQAVLAAGIAAAIRARSKP